MTINRIIRGGLTFKVNKVKICKEISVDLPAQHILKTAAKYMHKHLMHRKCDAVINDLIIPKRVSSHIYVRNPLNGVYNASLDKITELYNRMPAVTKSMTMRQFNRYCTKNDIKQS